MATCDAVDLTHDSTVPRGGAASQSHSALAPQAWSAGHAHR